MFSEFSKKTKEGFSLLELLIVIAIIAILTTVATIAFRDSQKKSLVKSTADNIIFHLEEAKANAQAGKNNEDHGIKFFDDSYVLFSGDSYDSGDSTNVEYQISDQVELSGTDDTIVFSKIYGQTGETSTTTVSLIEDPSKKVDIVISSTGTINKVDY